MPARSCNEDDAKGKQKGLFIDSARYDVRKMRAAFAGAMFAKVATTV